MNKIASPKDLRAEVQRILDYANGPEKPSREKLASDLRSLADRVATTAITESMKTFDRALDHFEAGIKELKSLETEVKSLNLSEISAMDLRDLQSYFKQHLMHSVIPVLSRKAEDVGKAIEDLRNRFVTRKR